LHRKHSEEGMTCYSCHDTHGSEQERLINFELGPMLSVPAARNSQTAWFVVGSQHGCALTCHGKLHNGDTSGSFRYP
jgi:predicted CXXCH cytochrome family protein